MGGIRSLNVALRQDLDLYVCVRRRSGLKEFLLPLEPHKTNMTIFRENTEDIYAGIEFQEGSEDNKKFMKLFCRKIIRSSIKNPFPESSGIGIAGIKRRNRAFGSCCDRLCHRAEEA